MKKRKITLSKKLGKKYAYVSGWSKMNSKQIIPNFKLNYSGQPKLTKIFYGTKLTKSIHGNKFKKNLVRNLVFIIK